MTLDLTQHTDVHVLYPLTTEADLVGLNKQLPSDTHLVRYSILNEVGGEEVEYISALRAYKMSDIFDAVHDNGCKVLEIRPGFGSIRPNLFNQSNGT